MILQNDSKLNWTEEADSAFDLMKLTEAPVLIYPDPNKLF